jgi:hypothetical protein
MINKQVAVTTSATQLVTSIEGQWVIFTNSGATACFIGTGSALTASNGYELAAGASSIRFVTTTSAGDSWYAICASGSTTVD